eukprot:3723136-Pyramimonas_sp.AAC.1
MCIRDSLRTPQGSPGPPPPKSPMVSSSVSALMLRILLRGSPGCLKTPYDPTGFLRIPSGTRQTSRISHDPL